MSEDAQSEMDDAVVRLLKLDEARCAGAVSEVLSGRSLKELSALPGELAEQRRRVAEDTTRLVLENYATFLRLAVNVSKTRRTVNETKVLQSALQDDLKQLQAACTSFQEVSVQISERRATSRAMLQHYPQMLEILEIPQLVDACVKSRTYEKALELIHFARRTLAQLRVPVLEQVSGEIKLAADMMRDQIYSQLSGECDMETAIRCVDFLRRLDVDCDELELRTKFLHHRNLWMNSAKASLSQAQTGRWLCAYAERLRTDLFLVVTQYNTLFLGEVIGDSHLLWSFAFQKISEFTELLDRHFPSLTDGEEMGAVFEQCMYCGSSLARVGMDFRILVHPVVERSVVRMFERKLEAALFFFRDALRTHSWRIDTSAENDQVLTSIVGESDSNGGGGGGSGLAALPPMTLLRHTPLAHLLNELVDSLNHLRYCIVVSVMDDCKQLLRKTLTGATGALAVCAKIQTAKNMVVVTDMQKELADHLIPHVESCMKLLCTVAKEENAATDNGTTTN